MLNLLAEFQKNVAEQANAPSAPVSGNAPQPIMELSETELELLSRAVYAEARGESYEGQVAVAAVILNRVKDEGFPDTVSGVIYEQGQFASVRDGQINLIPDEAAALAALDALNGSDPSGGALYFWNPEKAPGNAFLNSLSILCRIGAHVFAIEK